MRIAPNRNVATIILCASARWSSLYVITLPGLRYSGKACLVYAEGCSQNSSGEEEFVVAFPDGANSQKTGI